MSVCDFGSFILYGPHFPGARSQSKARFFMAHQAHTATLYGSPYNMQLAVWIPKKVWGLGPRTPYWG